MAHQPTQALFDGEVFGGGIPIIFEAALTPDFASHTQTAFSYSVDVGVQSSHYPLAGRRGV
ncbi:hypothetical protein [Legionella sp. km772]|uniref:hypothetical protein n=1 Tax=Legionella sp. km772 TaxID=2498111 RepID=UPI000F8CEF1B|nr:hypothetical protein ELY15_13360 [Legionella sp. km772]